MATERKDSQNQVIRELKGQQIEVNYEGIPVEVFVGTTILRIGKPKDLGIREDPEPDKFNIIDVKRLAETNATQGRVRLRDGGAVILGRTSTFGFRFGPDVSRLHVGIKSQGNKLVIKDLNSRLGTTVIAFTH